MGSRAASEIGNKRHRGVGDPIIEARGASGSRCFGGNWLGGVQGIGGGGWKYAKPLDGLFLKNWGHNNASET